MKLTFTAGLIATGLVFASCSDDNDEALPTVPPSPEAPSDQGTIGLVPTITADEQFKTLEELLQLSGLADTISAGEYTIFAPNDAAFAKVPPADLEALKTNQALLKDVLLGHITAGKTLVAELSQKQKVITANDRTLVIGSADNIVTIAGAPIVKTDLLATNGVIHVIGQVLIPSDTAEVSSDVAPIDEQPGGA